MNGKYFTILFSYAGNCSDSVVITVNVVELLLLAAGDIEINPGPVHPGLLKALLKDLRSIKEKYESLGVKLEVPLEQISVYEKIYSGDHARIFAEVINIWLNSHDEDYAELFINEKKEMDRICLTSTYTKKDYVNTLCKALREIGEVELAECLKRKHECQQRLLQSLLQDLRSVEEKYVTVGVELEVGMFHISLLESKYQDDKRKIFTEVLHCWLDNYSRDDFIQDLCGALTAVDEPNVAERIALKYSQRKELFKVGNMVEMEDTTDQPQIKKGPLSVDKSGIMEPENQEKVNTLVSSAEDEIPRDPASYYISRESREGLEAVDGIPKAQKLFQVEGQTQSKTVKADLLVYLPSGVSPSKLDGLGETMMNHGDTDYPLEVKTKFGTVRGNTPWKTIVWQILHPEHSNSGKVVMAYVTVHFRIDPSHRTEFMNIYLDGVQNYLKAALDQKYEVEISHK